MNRLVERGEERRVMLGVAGAAAGLAITAMQAHGVTLGVLPLLFGLAALTGIVKTGTA